MISGFTATVVRIVLPAVLLFSGCARAWQTPSQPQSPTSPAPAENPYEHDWKKELYESGIQDNSFLVEESYNQDFGVVQHINNFTRLWQSNDWVYSFTQEWPIDAAPKNQLSYTLQGLHAGDFQGSGAGFGYI